MTDFSLPTNDHGPSVVDSVATNGLSPAKPVHPSASVLPGPEEEEDYTIKCICGFYDDDGNTVFCDRCETWQHIECYYFKDGEVPDVRDIDHWCADCDPRPLDAHGAAQRQTMRREHSDLGERKVKKPTTKGHKKKVRASEPHLTLVNGASPYDKNDHLYGPDRLGGSPREYFPAAKRPKTSHRYSSSTQSPSIPYGGYDKRSSSISRVVQSPSKTPGKHSSNGYLSEPYSHEFMHLYDDDPGDATMQANLFNDITITSSLSSWTQDAEALADASNGLSPQDIFHRCEQPLDSMDMPVLHKQYKQGDVPGLDGRYPQWTFLTTDTPLVKGSIVGELKGKIGHMRDYVQDPTNRWEYLRHPAPFVFFHPKLPIYIDTRREGTRCRYLRRSCRPNLIMTTILENGSDYRFCFVAKDDLETGSELTVGWTLDQHIRNFFHRRSSEQFKNEGATDRDEEYVSDWVGKVLADFGGCACDLPAECSLAKYDRRCSPPPRNGTLKLSNGIITKGRNGYGKRHSPVSDHTVHNRSHRIKQQEDDDDDRSTSGSVHSKQRSRETTPTRNSATENAFAMAVELSDREKRKIAALERNFEQIEQDKHQPGPKKKKRSSVGTSMQTSGTPGARQHSHVSSSGQPNTPGTAAKSHYMDAGTLRRKSGSPVGKPTQTSNAIHSKLTGRRKRLPSQLPATPKALTAARPNYVSTSMQTEPDERTDWFAVPKQEQPRKPFVSLSKQLLLRAQRGRAKMEQRLQAEARQKEIIVGPTQASNGQPGEDTEMQDVQLGLTGIAEPTTDSSPMQKPRPPDGSGTQSEGTNPQIKPPPPPQPSNGHNAIGLRVQLPSPASQLGGDAFSASPRDVAHSPVATRSPFVPVSGTYPPLFPTSSSTIIQPSPVKKKVSLGEYMSRRREPSSTGEKPSNSSPVLSQGPIKPPLVGIDEARGTAEEGSVIVNTPKVEDPSSEENKQP
ncbi:MAG: hypothetical protein Q9201_004344 [Fulgogasparrea decipioides]